MSEHHSTPLNLTPSPSVFLAAAAQRTRRLRLGALVYILPAHRPLRLAEKSACSTISAMAGSKSASAAARLRTDRYYGIDPAHAPAMLSRPTTSSCRPDAAEVDFRGKHYQFENVPIEMKPAQLPHPPLWYAVPVPEGAAWPAQNRINIVCGGPLPRVREITDRYRAEWAAPAMRRRHAAARHQPLRGRRRHRSRGDGARPPRLAGVLRELHEALDRAWHPAALCADPGRFRHHGQNGGALAGSPGTIRERVRTMATEAGASYFMRRERLDVGRLEHADSAGAASFRVSEYFMSAFSIPRPSAMRADQQALYAAIRPSDRLRM